MDTPYALTIRDGKLLLEPANASNNQLFRLVSQADGSTGIRHINDDKLTVTMSDTAVWVQPYEGSGYQSFKLNNHADGSVSFQSHYIDIPRLLEATFSGSAPALIKNLAQRFYLRPNGSGVSLHKISQVFDTAPANNELLGTLQGSVKFAQSQVVPVTPKSGDKQPHLVAGRKTLLMLKPLPLRPAEVITAHVLDSRSALLGTLELQSPPNLPNTIYHSPANLDEESFNFPSPTQPYTISSQDELQRLNTPGGAYLRDLLTRFDQVEIRLADGAWTSDIYVPAPASSLKGNILIKHYAGFETTLHFDNRTLQSTHGSELKCLLIGGQWVNSADWENRLLTYTEGTWSAIIPAQWIKPGIGIKFEAGSAAGVLNNIEVGATCELLINTIDIGMLTPPRNEYAFAVTPDAHREYFQRVPLTRMIVNEYQSLHLPEVMLPNGTLLTDFDPSEGGWHTGTMRQNIGKELISLGINHANYGINSSPGSGEWTPFVAAQLTAHNSCGKYANGIQVHGGSGGAGMVTLDQSLGNEFSHEVGHNYGLGHFPGEFDGSVHRPAEDINASWGWDMDLNKFTPNFSPSITQKPTCHENRCQAPFHGRSFGMDPMAGGAPMGGLNRFTLHTPFTAQLVQRFLESKAIFSSDSPTGFRKWNPTSKSMEPYTHSIDSVSLKQASGQDFPPSAPTAEFDLQSILNIAITDADRVEDVHIPSAALHTDCVMRIEHKATQSRQLHLNDQVLPIARGFTKTYVSTGTSWAPCILLTASMARCTVTADDLRQSNVNTLLAQHPVLNLLVREGEPGADVHLPPASQAYEGRVVIVDHRGIGALKLYFNGVAMTIPCGIKKSFICETGLWHERSRLVDTAVARIPQAFGVPVTTLIGYYYPEGNLPAYIYPGLHGAYGYTYPDDNDTPPEAGWQLKVLVNGQAKRFTLANRRLTSGVMNKFHINVAASNGPIIIALLRNGVTVRETFVTQAERPLKYTINGE